MIAPADQPEEAGGGIMNYPQLASSSRCAASLKVGTFVLALTLTNSDAPVKVSTQQRKFNVHHKKGRVLYRLR